MKKTAALLALLTALTTAGCAQETYPSSDTGMLQHRLTGRAQWAYEAMDLPPHREVAPVRVEDASDCLTGIVGREHSVPDVVVYELSWTVGAVPQSVARGADARLRRRFAAAGWKVTYNRTRRNGNWVEIGFRMRDPRTGDQFDLSWNDATTSLFLSGYTPCTRVPHGAADVEPSTVWSPRTH